MLSSVVVVAGCGARREAANAAELTTRERGIVDSVNDRPGALERELAGTLNRICACRFMA
jgi:hypothetical protein